MKKLLKIKLGGVAIALASMLFGLFLILAPSNTAHAAFTTDNITASSTTWSSSAVTVYIKNAKDTTKGLHSTPYCFILGTSSTKIGTSSCSWQSSYSKSITTNGDHYVHAWVRNSSGSNKYAWWIRIKVDTSAPSFSVTGTSTSWTSGTRTLTFKANDGNVTQTSGIEAYYCNGSWKDVTSYTEYLKREYSCKVTSDAKTVTVGVRDRAGNSITQNANVYIDSSSPSLSVSGTSTAWTSGSRALTLRGSDSGSGVNAYYCNGKWNSSTASSYPCTVTSEGKTASVGVRDKAGYETKQNVNVYIDKTAPTASLSGGSTSWRSSFPTITMTASDTGSGITTYGYCFIETTTTTAPGSDSCSWQSSKYYYPETEGTRYVHGYAKDVAGYTKHASYATVKVDTTAPTYTSVTGGGSSYLKSTTISITGAADSASGLATSPYCFYKSTSASAPGYSSCSWGSSSTKTYSSTYTGYVHTYIKDAAGNVKYSSYRQLKIDAELPTLSNATTIDTANINLIDGTFSFRFAPSDAKSGISTVTVNKSGSYKSNMLTFPISQISNNKLSFSYTITDVAGNSKTGTINVDTTVDYDEALRMQVENGLNQTLETNVELTRVSDGKQLNYTINQEAEAIIGNLSAFNIDVESENLGLKFVFVSSTLNSDLTVYDDLSRTAALSTLQSGLTSPLGQKQQKDGEISLVLIFEELHICVASGTIETESATALSTTFDTYENVETNYEGAGLGNDGTVVSFSDDATSSMAVTLGASNMIEKRDVYGNLEWEKAITSSGKIELKKVINNEYGILVLGETTSGSINGISYPLKGGKDILVIRLDKQGNILFTNVIGTKYDDVVISADMTSSRIAILSSNAESSIVYTIDIDGTNVDENIVAGIGVYPNNVALIDNKMVITGSIVQETMAASDDLSISPKMAYIQLYEDGVLSWDRVISASSDVSLYSLDVDNNNIYIVGQSEAAILHDNLGNTKIIDSYGNKDGMIIKYDYLGNMIQLSSIGGVGDDTFNQILVTDNKVIVAGTTTSSEITASHFSNPNFHINKLGETDTVIITLNDNLIIQEGLNLSYEEGIELQEIGINQYTEQLMILSSSGVHTQKVVDNTFNYEVVYENGTLKVNANEEIASAVLFDGTNYYDIEDGIKVPYGAYEIKVTSVSGQSYTQVVGFSAPVEHSILPMILLFISIASLAILTITIIKRYKKLVYVA